jgi:ABC-type Fe3+/spermidine/putrescine transport system ATPase subunit
VLHEGKTQQIGNPEELYARPANLEVARFMGYRNILDLDGQTLAGRSSPGRISPGRISATQTSARRS